MPSLFKGASIPQLEQRRDLVDMQIASLVAFRQKIERRIEHLLNRDPKP